MSFDTALPSFNASDPYATFFNTSCFDLLLIELVPLAERMARRLFDEGSSTTTDGNAKASSKAAGSVGAGAGGPVTAAASTTSGGGTAMATPGGGVGGSIVANKEKHGDDEPFRDAMYFRLESLGYRVGQGLSERFSRDRPRFTDNLDVIKFLCKDLWTLVFKKQIDNLKTNHRGVFVLTDDMFRPFSRMSMSSRAEAILRAQPYLWFPCGVIRGALASLGINATVQAETTELPRATFQIKIMPTRH